MNRNLLLIILLLCGFTSGISAQIVQPVSADTSSSDTTIVEERGNNAGHELVWPKYPGGDMAFAEFITKNYQYSESDKQNGVSGKLVLDVLIEKDGSTSAVTVYKSASREMDAEAVRVIKLMPKRIPGTKDGKPARFRISLPLGFSYSTSKTNPN